MYNGDWNLIKMHQANLDEQRRRAKRERLVKEALAGRRGSVRIYAPVLARLGAGLVAWGTDLQTRYGTLRPLDDMTPVWLAKD
jgi:hypothetical protein